MNKGYLFVITAVLFWALSSGVLVKLTSIPPLPFFAIGAFWGCIFILGALFFQKSLKSLFQYSKKQYLLIIMISISLGISNLLFFFALKNGLIANAVLSHNLYPILIVLLFAPILLQEKIKLKIFLLVMLSFAGLFILTIPSFKSILDIALVLGAISAAFTALSSTLEKKLALITKNPLVPVFYKNFIPFLMLIPFALPIIGHGISAQNWLLTAIWGILVLGVSFIFYFKSLQLIPVTHATIITYGEPIGAIILAYFIFKQPINGFILLGGVLILASGIILIKTTK